jgi:uncharacterized protein YbjT (DUF2867 family)
MILVAGGTGTLGTLIVRRLTARSLPVRSLSRDVARAQRTAEDCVNFVAGDVRDRRAVERALAGVTTVISAVQGFAGRSVTPRSVDYEGNRTLIQAAQNADVKHFILISVHGAAPDHPLELFRMKYRAEEELRASRLTWTIIRCTAFVETWARLIGEPLLRTGRTRIFGRGKNPINFVSAHDVAAFAELAVVDPSLAGVILEVGGPQNLSLVQVARVFADVIGSNGRLSHIPLPMMRLASVLMRPIAPSLARQIQAGVVMDTSDMSFDPAAIRERYPSVPSTSLAVAVRRDFLNER